MIFGEDDRREESDINVPMPIWTFCCPRCGYDIVTEKEYIQLETGECPNCGESIDIKDLEDDNPTEGFDWVYNSLKLYNKHC